MHLATRNVHGLVLADKSPVASSRIDVTHHARLTAGAGGLVLPAAVLFESHDTKIVIAVPLVLGPKS